MKFPIILAVMLTAMLPAFGEDVPKPADPVLTIRDIIGISASLAQMNCEKKILKAGAEEKADCIPYSASVMKAGLTWQIAENRRKAVGVVQQYQKLVNEHLAKLPRKDNGDFAEGVNAEFQLFQAELLDKPAFIPGEAGLAHFKKAEIDALNLPPEVLTGLLPIVDK